MSNGYPPSGSPLGGSPSPGPSPALGVGGGSANKGSNPSRHSPQPPPPPPPPHPHRTNLRVVIPTPLTQPLSDDTSYDVSVPGKEEYAKKAVHSRSELVWLAEHYAYNRHLSVIIYNSDSVDLEIRGQRHYSEQLFLIRKESNPRMTLILIRIIKTIVPYS